MASPPPLQWQRRGELVFDAQQHGGWFSSHAQTPTPLMMADRIRIYCNSRAAPDERGNYQSRISYVDVARDDPSQVIGVAEAPILSLGRKGAFDEFGNMVQCVVDRQDRGQIWLYYVGWSRKVSVPFDWAMGLAISEDGGHSFERYGDGPIMGASLEHPYLLTGADVHWIDGAWHMWHSAGVEWKGDPIEPIYRMYKATSDDGLYWRRSSTPCFSTIVEDECQAISTVMQHGDVWLVLFTYRPGADFRRAGNGYRIGCAYSTDLKNWTRDDSIANLPLAETGWDSEMMCYPSVFEAAGQTWLFYCGNHFGQQGFGLAQLER